MKTDRDTADAARDAADSQRMTASIGEIRDLERRLAGLRRALLAGGAPGADAGAGPDADLDLLLVRCGDHLLALPLRYVEEVVQMPALAPVPGGARALAGLVDYHGTLAAVIDLGRLVGGQPTAVTRFQSLVVCEVAGRPLAVQVDEVTDVVTVPGSRIRVAEELLPGALRTAGVVTVGSAAAHLVDLAWIALGTELSELAAGDGTRALGAPGQPEPAP